MAVSGGADVLRRAAALMRERAGAASPSPWVAEYRVVRATGSSARTQTYREPPVILQGPGSNRERLVSRAEQGANAVQAASWHPAVALAVADWLEDTADENGLMCSGGQIVSRAYAVARAYLGEQP